MVTYSKELKLASDVILQASKILLSCTPHSLGFQDREIKLLEDKEMDTYIRNFLEKNSSYKVYSEESLGSFQSIFKEMCWIVDPIDGSLNYLRGIPFYGISIALWDRGEPILGVIFDLAQKNLYQGIVNQGATQDQQSIEVSKVTPRDAIMATGIPSQARMQENLDLFQKNAFRFKKLRWIGSASLSLAYVASGKIDAYQEHGIKIWDVAAGLAIVKAAKGSISFTINSDETLNVYAHNGLII